MRYGQETPFSCPVRSFLESKPFNPALGIDFLQAT